MPPVAGPTSEVGAFPSIPPSDSDDGSSGGALPGSDGAPPGIPELSSFAPSQRPAWSADGRWILYSAWGAGEGTEIWDVGADGGRHTRLSDLPGRDATATDPAQSPDGIRVAFTDRRPGGGLYVVGADGTGQRRLGGAAFFGIAPAWSPDGSRLLLAVHGPGSGGIYAVPVDGPGPAEQLVADGSASEPTWSPDGARVAYAAAGGGAEAALPEAGLPEPGDGIPEGSAIVAVQADGSGRVTLADMAGDDVQPAWSPDGGSVAFVSVEIVPYRD